jgi:glycosyltransferase involved in cell wall biosynthesis
MTHALLIHQAFVGPTEPGGTRHFELAQHMVKAGHQFTIVASDVSYLTGQSVSDRRGMYTEQSMSGVRVLRARTYASLHRSFFWRLVSFSSFMLSSVWAGLRVGPVDIVMGTSPPIFQAVSAMVVAALRRRPFLLEIRDLWPEFAIGMGVLRSRVLISLSRKLEHILYSRATHLLVNSPAYKDYLIAAGVPEAKVTVIPNGVDLADFSPDADGSTTRADWNLEGQFVVMYAGALGMANDLGTLIDAASLLRHDGDGLQIVIVGDGGEAQALRQKASSLGLTNVTFTGTVAKSRMPDVLAAADVCVAILQDIPMFRTTYPNKVFDYMASGRPVILAIDGVIRKVVETARGGVFVPPGDAVALADAIRQLRADPTRAAQMGKLGREYVAQHFDRSQQAGDFALLVERLALPA